MAQQHEIAQLQSNMERIAEILAIETELMRSQKIEALDEYQDEKHKLIEAMEQQKERMRQRSVAIDAQSPEGKVLTKTGKHLDAVMMEYGKELTKQRAVNERIMQVIIDEVEKHFEEKSSHSANSYSSGATKRANTVPPVKVNETS